MIITQPSFGFGDKLGEELRKKEDDQLKWKQFEFAVAWVNRRGAQHVAEPIKSFLSKGGSISAVVGLDFSHTSKEGLKCFLDIEAEFRRITTHVFYDENPACIFHPKVFLFKNKTQALLYVGSNNMTGAGLSTNIEMSLGFTGCINDETIIRVSSTLLTWRNENTESRTRRLTYELLEELCDRGYVKTEADIQKSRQSNKHFSVNNKEPLFGRSQTTRREGRSNFTSELESKPKLEGGDVVDKFLLMRVKPRRNGSQIQISMKIYDGAFMNGTDEVFSAKTQERREIGFNFTKRKGIRKKNTARFEAPELEGMINPVVRFQWVTEPYNQLQYEAFDAETSSDGLSIYNKLSNGITSPPVIKLENIVKGTTVLSKSDKEKAQWYCMD